MKDFSLLAGMPATRRAALLGAGGALLGAGVARAQTASAGSKVLRVVPSADLTVLDPMFSAIIITRLYSLMVYDTLFAWDSKLRPQPQMVENWTTSPDQLTWTFHLRDGLAFHDGSPVTSADVVASLKRWMSRDVLGMKLATYVRDLKADGSQSFIFELSRPAAFLTWALGSGVGQIPAIMRAADLQGDSSRPVTTAIGSGPFRFNRARWVSGSLVVFDRNEHYQPRKEPADGLAGGRVVKVDSVEWRVMPDPSVAAAALQTGEVDLLEAPSLDLLPQLGRDPGVVLRSINALYNQGMLRGNALYPPFNNEHARQALAYLADQSDYMAAVAGDQKNWQTCSSYYICGGPYGPATSTTKPPGKDLALVRKLMAQAGYNGEKLVFVGTKDLAPIGQMTEVAADGLQRAGVNLDVQWSDWGTMATRTTLKTPPDKGGWNLFVSYSSGITAHSPMTNVGTNMAAGGANWNGWPTDATVEQLRQAFVDAPGDATAHALQAQLEIARPYIPLGEFVAPIAYRKGIQGVLSSPVITYWNIEKA